MKLFILTALLLLTACGSSDSASYLIDGPSHSLTLVRNQTFAWSDDRELELVTTNTPDCMRRHRLKAAPDAGFKLEVFRAIEGGIILKQGSNWYIADIQKCLLQQYSVPPVEPGDALGAFTIKDQRLVFVAAAKAPAPPAVPQEAPANTSPAAR